MMKLQGVVLAMVMMLGVFNMGTVKAADAIFAFGDSYMDTGNMVVSSAPYGISWPGYPDNRRSDGRVQADYYAELFELPNPTPFLRLQNESSQARNGVNFARGGAGITYANGITPVSAQVDEMQTLVAKGVLTQHLLRNSVVVLNIGTNDYGTRNLQAPFRAGLWEAIARQYWYLPRHCRGSESVNGTKELAMFVNQVVDGIAVTILRLYDLGVRHMVVSNLPLLVCIPLLTQELAFTACSTNATILNQTSLHNALLQERVKDLNQHLRGLHVVIVDQTKAFQELFAHGSRYGFVDPLIPCCRGNGTNLYNVVCGTTDPEGRALYAECEDPSKAVLFDTIHPIDAAWKAIINLYASVAGFTMEGPMLHTWIRKYNV